MNYELGWLSELVIAMQQDGMNVRRINIERIHASGYSGSGGRPFLLDKQTVLRAIRNGTLGASSFKPEYVMEIDDFLQEEWLLAYPPAPELPDCLPGGLFLVQNRDGQQAWLSVEPGRVELLLHSESL